MKKSMLFGSFVMLAFSPTYLCAQDIQLPTVEIRVTQDLVPKVVKEAVLKDFGEGHNPIVWVTPQSLFDTYEWAQSTNVDNLDIYYYALQCKTTVGSTLYVVYSPEGKLINSKEVIKNFRPELRIMLALQNTEYKDWAISKDLLVKKVSSNGSEKERYALMMKKGNAKKTIFLDAKGSMLANNDDVADVNW
jgi:hypothetical protein